MLIKGTHIILDGYDLAIDFHNLDIPIFKENIKNKIRKSGMTILGESFYDFMEPVGAFTYMILLGESHFSIHTFPENKKITCDIYSCNISKDFSKELENIIGLVITTFQIISPKIHRIER